MHRQTIFAGLVWPSLALAQPPLVLPVANGCISSPFGPRTLPQHPEAGSFHPGVDLPAPNGAPVRAVAAGTVIRRHQGGLGGLELFVQHVGYVGLYAHLGAIAAGLRDGMTVTAGEPIGSVGDTGLVLGYHLYFEMIAGRPIDPAPYLHIPLCTGATAHSPLPADILSAGGKLPVTRRYYLLDDAGHGQR